MLFAEDPNDTVETAQPFRGGARLIGKLETDGRDKFRWQVDDAEADQLWRLELQAGTEDAIRGLLGTMPEVDAAEDSGVAEFGMATDNEPTPDAETAPLLELEATARRAVQTHDGLMVPHGEYLIRLLTEAGGGDYQFTLTPVETIELHGTADADTAGEDLPVRVDRDWYFQINAEAFELPLRTEETEDWLWQIRLLGELGADLTATLLNADGEALTDPIHGNPLNHRWLSEPLPERSRLRIRRDDGAAIGRVAVRLEQDGERPEPQPDAVATTLADAIELAPDDTTRLTLAPETPSYLRFTLDETQANEHGWQIDAAGDTADVTLCLGEFFTRDEACRQASAQPSFDALRLTPNVYYLRLEPDDQDAEVDITLRAVPPGDDDQVPEPSDIRDWAAPLAPGESLHGTFTGERQAWFRLQVLEADQLWRIEATGDGLDGLRIVRRDTQGTWRQSRDPWVSDTLDGFGFDRLQLLPGEYYLRLDGKDTDYRIQAQRLGAPDPTRETEPNDDPANANSLHMGKPVRGELRDSRDTDYFRFTLHGWNRVRLEILPPEQGSIAAALYTDSETRLLNHSRLDADADPLRATAKLPPGEYYLEISGRDGSSAYQLAVDTMAPWDIDAGHPFGEDISFAAPLPDDGLLDLPHSELGGDYQWFLLPTGESDREIRLTAFGPNRLARAEFEILDDAGVALDQEDIDPAADDAYARGVSVPAGGPWYLRVNSGRRGTIQLQVDDPLLAQRAEERQRHRDDITMALDARVETLAAWSGQPQQVETELQLENHGDELLEVPLSAHANHSGWQVRGLPETYTLEPGGETTLELDWILPAGLPDDSPVRLFIRAGGTDAQLAIAVDSESQAVATADDLTDAARAARGMVDLAWEGLGARFVDAESGDILETDWGDYRLYHLIDGMSSAGSSIRWGHLRNRVDPGDPLPPLRLAGDGGEIRTLVLDPRSKHSPLQRWREVEISIGPSFDSLTPLKTIELDNLDGDQYFPLDEPVEARYIGVRPLSYWGPVSRSDSTGIGALQVLGKPTGALADSRPNLLDPALGGHWIYSRPDVTSLRELVGGSARLFRPSDGTRQRGEVIRGRRIDLVFGFLQQRAARLDSLSWKDDANRDGLPVERVRVFSSLESPVGPWTDHGRWTLERDADGLAHLQLEEPVWARYLRLEVTEPEPLEDGGRGQRWRIPAELGAYEAASPDSGESVLAHWQRDGREGPFEAVHQGPDWPVEVDDADSTPDAPWHFAGKLSGRVDSPGDTRSYRLTLEPGDNTLALRLREDMAGRLITTLQDAEGNDIALDWTADGHGWREATAVDLDPGEYRLDVTEPVRAIAFLWDASGSLRAHERTIYQSVSRFAERLRPGEEIANLMPLGGPMLMADWAESPQRLRRTLEAYERQFTSSNSEPALLQASRELEMLQHDDSARGEVDRVIFLITDAELRGRTMDVWPVLERVRPRIFALEISHGMPRDIAETRWYQNLMRSWSAVGGGHYSYNVDRGGLIRAFEQGMRAVRQPTRYFLDAEMRYQEPPEPGTLEIVSGETPALAAGAVHLIFDASGSMLRQMEGGRRIEVARRIVNEVLDERIPEQVPVALRAYGHTEPHSCETELLVPPTAGNHNTVRDTVNAIQAINLARTPLAASLDAVPEDLADVDAERKLVVMLTDGEETCDGDVEASVAALVDAGMDLRLNIVGFHIEEIGMQAEFERFARDGGGAYFESSDGEQLSRALQQALTATYRIVDSEQDVVAEGRVDDGQALALDAGDYELLVDGADGERRFSLTLAPGSEKTFRLDQQ
ncbi:VWA domain-containing protein [Methylonatrum kenyense]|uniref:VWA domain-containing protein n=1 Tax=Methylonatrum kenyense TaxID=455253 RepID=UPI0020C13B7E|nr:VWA domain-containing protein [Methylonatrum kenyense]MCK8516366.1 VWA domain-containing protein [Methylonatrum kenyense]